MRTTGVNDSQRGQRFFQDIYCIKGESHRFLSTLYASGLWNSQVVHQRSCWKSRGTNIFQNSSLGLFFEVEFAYKRSRTTPLAFYQGRSASSKTTFVRGNFLCANFRQWCIASVGTRSFWIRQCVQSYVVITAVIPLYPIWGEHVAKFTQKDSVIVRCKMMCHALNPSAPTKRTSQYMFFVALANTFLWWVDQCFDPEINGV